MEQPQHRLRFGPAGVDYEERINFARMREERAAKSKNRTKEAWDSCSSFNDTGKHPIYIRT